MESLSRDSDSLGLSVRRPTARVSFSDVVNCVDEVLMVVISTIEGDLKIHLVTSAPASGRSTHDSGVVHVLDGHKFREHVLGLRSETAVVFGHTGRSIDR